MKQLPHMTAPTVQTSQGVGHHRMAWPLRKGLQLLADSIRHVVRDRVDSGFRLGGDEFVVLLPRSDHAAAAAVVKRIRQRCARLSGVWPDGPLSVSAGVAQFAPQGSAKFLMQQADEAMYRDKPARQGRAGRAGLRG